MNKRINHFVILLIISLTTPACSITRMAHNAFADAVSNSGDSYGSDNDIELVGQAVPFGLKTMEGMLENLPEHRGLLLSLSRGFTQYAYVYIEQPANELEAIDIQTAYAQRERALNMYLRARDYGLRGLAVNQPELIANIRIHPAKVLASTRIEDVPLLYWTAAAWASAISLGKNNPDLVADIPVVHELIYRAYNLDETYDQGAIHIFLISYEMGRQGLTKESVALAHKHFHRAIELSDKPQAGPYVSMAEAVTIPAQDRKKFEHLLKKALSIEVATRNDRRLANLVMQRRARWLLDHVDNYFLE